MRNVVLPAVVAVLLATPLVAQEAGETTSASSERRFTLRLDPLLSPRWEAQRELRLSLWDSPMSRLELAAAREMWAARHPGPTGIVSPLPPGQLPLRLDFAGAGLHGYGHEWNQMSWQEKVGAGAQAGLLVWMALEAARHGL